LKPTLLGKALDEYELIEVLGVYISKMIYHDYILSQLPPSLIAASSLYVSLKLAEKFRANAGVTIKLLSERFMKSLCSMSKYPENEIISEAKKILFLSQNFERLHSGLNNLKKTHFSKISKLIDLPR
jgi:hypothetical protein